MKKCKKCGVHVNTDLDYCPLCFDNIEGKSEKQPLYQMKNKNEKENQNRFFITKLFSFLSLCAISICVFVNFMIGGIAWSGLVTACIIYLWVVIGHTILSKQNIFKKIFLQILAVIGVLYLTNVISGGGDWLVKYVLPSLSLGAVTVLAFIEFISTKRKSYSLSFLVIYLILTIMSIILVAGGFDSYKLLNLINIIVCGLSILGTFIFGFKYVKQDFLKIFHL